MNVVFSYRWVYVALFLGFSLAIGCSSNSKHVANSYDRPIPSSEPREELKLILDLETSTNCEEQFDIAMYQDLGVELIQWNEPKEGCLQRQVTVRFLTTRISREALIQRIRQHAHKVQLALN